MLSLVCGRAAPNLTQDVSVSRYNSFVLLYNVMHALSLIISFASANIFWYVTFNIHSVLADINFFSDSHTSTVLGENLPK